MRSFDRGVNIIGDSLRGCSTGLPKAPPGLKLLRDGLRTGEHSRAVPT
jgi:hypothetical protein